MGAASFRSDERAPKVIVLAEDEGLIRLMMADELAYQGFHVHQARNAEEAISLLDVYGDSVKALFTDIHMPGEVDGLELAHQTKRRWPHISLVLASGHVNPLQAELPQGSRFFVKPYDIDKVVEHLKTVTSVVH